MFKLHGHDFREAIPLLPPPRSCKTNLKHKKLDLTMQTSFHNDFGVYAQREVQVEKNPS